MATQETAVRTAADLPQDKLVLSLYFDTDPATGLWRDKQERLRALLDSCEQAVLDKRERTSFQKARGWAERYLDEHHIHGKGAALFHVPDSNVIWTTHLQAPIQNLARFQKGPYVQPLADLMASHPRYAVVLVDNEHGRVIVTQSGEMISTQDVRDYVTGRHRQTKDNPRVERHHAVQVQRHLRHVVAMLVAMKRAKTFDYLVLGGAAEALPKFQKELPPDLLKLVKANFTSPMYAKDAELLKAANRVIEAMEAAASPSPARDNAVEHTWP